MSQIENEMEYVQCCICDVKQDADSASLGNEYPEGEHLCETCEKWIQFWLNVCPLCRCEYLDPIETEDGDIRDGSFRNCKCYEWQHKRDTSGMEPKDLDYLKNCRIENYIPRFKDSIRSNLVKTATRSLRRDLATKEVKCIPDCMDDVCDPTPEWLAMTDQERLEYLDREMDQYWLKQ